MSESALDPRVERTRSVVLEATLDELAEVGYGALTVEGVARRAGVGKATMYRHWAGKLELVGDAVTTLEKQVLAPDTDDHRERVTGLIRAIAESLSTSTFSACVPALVDASERDDAVRRMLHAASAARRAYTESVLEDARRAGHLAADLDVPLIAQLLVGPLFLRRLMTPEPFPVDDVGALVAMVLDPYWQA